MNEVVLLVEDDEDIRGVLGEFLADAGYSVRLASDGMEALAIIAESSPAAIITDLNMPRLSGWELLHALAADPKWSRIPVAVITAEERFPAGYCVLRKPFVATVLIAFLSANGVSSASSRRDISACPSPRRRRQLSRDARCLRPRSHAQPARRMNRRYRCPS
jgi:CheY-like chemotaxis protein